MILLGRAFINENEGNDPAPTATRIKEQLKVYPYVPGGAGSSIGSYLTGHGRLGQLASPREPPVRGGNRAWRSTPSRPTTSATYEMLDALVQLEPAEALDTELAGQFAAIGIVKGEKFAPDPRLRQILDDAVAVGNAASRTLGMGAHPGEGFRYYDDDTAWWNMLFVGGFDFTNPPPMITAEGLQPFPNKGARQLHSRTSFFYTATGITPAMCMRLTNVGSQYLIANVDAGRRTFRRREDLPAEAARRTSRRPGSGPSPSMTTRPAQCCRPPSATRAPAARSTPPRPPRPRPTARTVVYFSPTQPDGVARGNWIQTDPEQGWFVVLRLYSPLQPFFDKTWRPGKIEHVS